MQRTGRPGRGERGRVAARTRALLGATEPPGPVPGRTGWLPGLFGEVSPASDEPNGGRPRPRWQPDRRSVLALAAVVTAVAAATLWWVLSSRPSQVAVQAVDASAGVGAPTAVLGSPLAGPTRAAQPSSTPSSRDLVVDVAGKVRHPGVYRLPMGSRVVDAVRAAGGALPGASTVELNLAAPLQDGQQVVVGMPTVAASGPTGASGATAGQVNLNTAGLDQLESLPGVGPVLAQNILDWRNEHGRFTAVSQLNEVTGIGAVKFATLRPHVTV